jgi:hypothetical protein
LDRLRRYLPELLAVAVTLLNAAKPVVVDDTAYLLHARHLAADPLHPYGFDIFWSDAPQPAMEVLSPPVIPGWLAVGIALFGESVVLLKLWLFPFLWVFTRSVWYLLGVFAPRQRVVGSVLLAFSPAVLPLVNFMLDVPATACGLGATACLVRGHRSGRGSWLVAAAVLGAIAAQTKYTMIVLPAVWGWYGLTHRCVGRCLLAAASGIALFAAWELFVIGQSGESHFWFHLNHQPTNGVAADASFLTKVSRWCDVKGGLLLPLLSYSGGLAFGWGLFVVRSQRVAAAGALFAVTGVLAVALVPASRQAIGWGDHERLTLPGFVFVGLGTLASVGLLAACARWLVRRRGRRPTAAGWFLVGWLALEVAGYFVLTPFPAARRIVTPTVVAGFVACAWVSRVGRLRERGGPPAVAVTYGLAAGLGLFALDAWDARAEHEAARRAFESVQPTPGRFWVQGHWGWQYAVDLRGGHLLIPGVSALRRGDWLLVPIPPGPDNVFYRPFHGFAHFRLDPSKLRFVREIAVDDRFPASTVPSLYGGRYPLVPRDGPRVVVVIYRVTADWTPEPADETR